MSPYNYLCTQVFGKRGHEKRKLGLLFHDAFHDFLSVVTRPWRVSDQHVKEHDTHAPKVDCLVIVPSLVEDLGCRELGRATNGGCRESHFAEPKVCQEYVPIGIQEYILGFQISILKFM